ncbi:hypothetical protein A3H40_02610 [Candidatus Daviesbacteria bacterium RIFCSPLOWO2_02_FULL_38_15]|uniref:Uncharacterized protein n=1 Tax=Candidatus Daviesbacteria bacterium RIFCSPLOWO2_02_FULL_38_15 TaxID=1797794 RepID=A0A1F5N5M0_9BACT|nr:MAG: hypothetical protein A3H40_02610 [Candidatus Daviesbacteria bacterium RIFCSPLOWO2_02_FULL_38_15]
MKKIVIIFIFLVFCIATLTLTFLFFNIQNKQFNQEIVDFQNEQRTTYQNSEATDQSEWLKYDNKELAFSVKYPSVFEIITDDFSFSKPNLTFTNNEIKFACGCAIYIMVENNPGQLSINDWLNSDVEKMNKYISQEQFNKMKNSSNETERLFSGSYNEENIYVSGIASLKQNYGTEGGGYERTLIPFLNKIYVITAWSDGYYFNHGEIRRDNGDLYNTYLKMISSFSIMSETQDISLWRTHQNNQTGLKFQYPTDASLSENVEKEKNYKDFPKYSLNLSDKYSQQVIELASYSLCPDVYQQFSSSMVFIDGYEFLKIDFLLEDRKHYWCYKPLPAETEKNAYYPVWIRGLAEIEMQKNMFERFVSSVEFLEPETMVL